MVANKSLYLLPYSCQKATFKHCLMFSMFVHECLYMTIDVKNKKNKDMHSNYSLKSKVVRPLGLVHSRVFVSKFQDYIEKSFEITKHFYVFHFCLSIYFCIFIKFGDPQHMYQFCNMTKIRNMHSYLESWELKVTIPWATLSTQKSLLNRVKKEMRSKPQGNNKNVTNF